MNVIKFDKLPELCLREIFTSLSLRDLVKCRAVSRQFKLFADRTEVTELAVTGDRTSESRNWYLTDRRIDFKNSIDWNEFAAMRSSSFKLNQQLLQHLKFLHIWLVRSVDWAYEFLNSLEQLVHLEFDSRMDFETRTLILPNLRVLVIKGVITFVLNTPKLEVLKCDPIDQIQFEYPQTIKRVECNNEGEDYGDLTELSNLEFLHIHLFNDGILDPISLSDFAALKELHLQAEDLLGIYEEGNDEFRRSVLHMMLERSVLQRDELKLYLNEVLLVDAKQLPALKVLVDPSNEDSSEIYLTDRQKDEAMIRKMQVAESRFKFMNYRLLLRDSYPDVTAVHFNELIRLDFEISEDFFVRFPRIRSLTVTDSVDRDQFEWFLQNANALRVLELTETGLDQAFVDRLPQLSSRLTRLELYESSGLITNFQFLLQFEQLEVFETDRPLHSFDLAAAALRISTKLKSLRCRSGNAFVKIQRSSALEDNYSLQLFGIKRNRESTETFETFQTFHRENLTWDQLAALYDSKKSGLTDEKKMRIKRARLE